MFRDSWRGKGGEGVLVQVIAQGKKVCETQPPIGHIPSEAVMIPVHILTMATGGKLSTGVHPFFGWRPVQPGSRRLPARSQCCRRQSIFSVIYTCTRQFNRTARSPCRRPTPPDRSQWVSSRARDRIEQQTFSSSFFSSFSSGAAPAPPPPPPLAATTPPPPPEGT